MPRVVSCAVCLLFLALPGCKSLFATRGLPPEPLFANRMPVESKAIAGPPVPLPFEEPAPPVNLVIAERSAIR